MMTKCVLGGYTYPVNPPESTNPPVKAVGITDTLSGRNYTIWPQSVSRQDVTQNWPAMRAAMYDALKAKSVLPGTLAFIDDDGVPYTVVVNALTYQRKAKGGGGYFGVTLKLNVVSSP